MVKEIWFNLPVKDIQKTKAFFTHLGFTFSTGFGDSPVSAVMQMGSKNVIVMFFEENMFKSFVQTEVTDAYKSSEVLISIDAESPAEVDAMAKKAEEAGGIVFGKPSEIQGWMYGCGFSDLDGHRWNILHMDMSKMPKA